MDYRIIVDNADLLEIEINRRANTGVLFFLALCTLGGTGTWLYLLADIHAYPYKFNQRLLIILLLLLGGGLYSLKLLLWQAWGRERIRITRNECIISRTGTILSVPRRYELAFTGGFTGSVDSPYPRWMRLLGMAGGQVEFYYLSEKRYFGQTLSLAQAQEIANRINLRITAPPAPDSQPTNPG
jgi:hypothetical protein